MPSYDYCVLRIVPSVEREEFVNAGVVLHSVELGFLDCRIRIDEARWRGLWPELDAEIVRRHLEAFPKICAGDPEAGPIAKLSRRERFQWMASPRSTVIQVSAVHAGVSDNPVGALEEIFRRLVLP